MVHNDLAIFSNILDGRVYISKNGETPQAITSGERVCVLRAISVT